MIQQMLAIGSLVPLSFLNLPPRAKEKRRVDYRLSRVEVRTGKARRVEKGSLKHSGCRRQSVQRP